MTEKHLFFSLTVGLVVMALGWALLYLDTIGWGFIAFGVAITGLGITSWLPSIKSRPLLLPAPVREYLDRTPAS